MSLPAPRSHQSSSQRRIQPLPTQLANQIAAGEVVERPASVVKELLENSLDAGARHIELELEQGGIRLIRVTDDGGGIHPDDLTLATAPHATSKIYSQQELQQIHSLGFRGEALASIASVSRFSLASRQAESEQGLKVEAGGAEPVPYAMPVGTRIEARELFYNTPARRKFLRTERTEFLHIEEVLKRQALSRYDVGFKLVHNGRQQLNLTPIVEDERRDQRVAAVLGKPFVQRSLRLEFEAAGMRLWGWVGEPGYSRSQADAQHFYLNGRVVRDKLINHAVRQAHQSLIEPGRHPAYLLYLEIDPQGVDVNVHPTKHEVRFRESRLVHDFLVRALQRTFDERGESLPLDEAQPLKSGSTSAHEPYRSNKPDTQGVAEQIAFYKQSLTPTKPSVKPSAATTGSHSAVVAVLHDEFLLMQREGEWGLMAVTAARQLLLQQRLSENLKTGEIQSQPLLIPATVTLEAKAVDRVLKHAETLLRLGVELEQLGEESVVLRQLPLLLRGIDVQPFVLALVECLKEVSDMSAFLQSFAQDVAPLLPVPDMNSAAQVIRELEQLRSDGVVTEQDLPWRRLSKETLSGLFAS